MADRVQLQQVFMNLMLNGIDAMKDTSGASELTIKSEVADGQLLISITDTGVDYRRITRTKSSRHSLRPRMPALVWGCPSVAPSLNRTAAGCGPSPPADPAPRFSSRFPSPSPHTHNLADFTDRITAAGYQYDSAGNLSLLHPREQATLTTYDQSCFQTG